MSRASELRALVEKATPGPWATGRFEVNPDAVLSGAPPPHDFKHAVTVCRGMIGPNRVANSDYLAACDPSTVLSLLSAVATLRRALKKIDNTGPFTCADKEFVDAALRVSADALAETKEWEDE